MGCGGGGIVWLIGEFWYLGAVYMSPSFSNDTIQLYCLCVDKFAFWLVIYIKTLNTVNNKTSTTQ